MSDKQRTCGDCAWWDKTRICLAPTSLAVWEVNMENDRVADKCPTFRSHSDQAIIDECHKLRSLGAAVEWSKIDRLVEIAAGRELERVKRCEKCGGYGSWFIHECASCQGTGYKKGGE